MIEPAAVVLNDFKRQWSDTSEAVLAAVARVGASGWYILGREVQDFESALAAFWRRGSVIGCASGLDAIEIALRALQLQPGEKVATTPLSAFATTLAIIRAGGFPVFVDVDPAGLLDLERCRAVLERDRSIRTLVPVHLYGQSLDLETLEELRQRFQLRIVEDCAQAIGATFAGRSVGSVGQLAATSFYPTKNLGALGDGGAVATDDPALATACRVLRDYGQKDKYVHDRLGLNSRLDELHAAILGGAFLPRLAQWTARRREAADRYLAGLRNSSVRVLPFPSRSQGVWHLFPVRVPAASREDFRAHLQRLGVATAIHYPHLIPLQEALEGQRFEVDGSLREAQALADSEVSLPMHAYLEDAEIDRVIDAVNAWSPG